MEPKGVGSILAGHRLEEVIGQGGMGIVYRATHLGLEREVALKVISPALAHDTNFRDRFKRESRIAGSLRHPHIVTIYDAGEDDGLLYITMEYVIGEDMGEILDATPQLSPGFAVEMTAQVSSALTAAHNRGLVHRDVKPANVLIQREAGQRTHAYLTDFGLTRHASSVGGLTGTGQWVGTLNYVAPEQLETGEVDGRADIYSLGCVLFRMVTGVVPFERPNDLAKLWAHVHEEPPRPSDIEPGVPKALDEVILTAMRKDREDRYPTANDLAAAARKAVAGGSLPAPAPKRPAAKTKIAESKPRPRPLAPAPKPVLASEDSTPAMPKRPRPPQRGRRLLILAGVLALLALAIGFLIAPNDKVEAQDDRVTEGHLSLTQPADWERDLSGGREIEGLALDDVIAFNYPPSMGRSIIRAGAVTHPGSVVDPLPPALADRFKAVPDAKGVTVGQGIEGVMYEGQTSGAITVSLLMVPTDDGYQAVACEVPTAELASIDVACESTMASLGLEDVKAVAVGPDAALASGLTSIFNDLGAGQQKADDGLGADKPDQQADAAKSLSSAYADAADAVADLDPPAADSGPVDDLGKAFAANADALSALADAARSGDEGAYADAKSDSERADEDAARARTELEKNGYEFTN